MSKQSNPMAITIDGQPASSSNISPSQKKAMDFILALPDGQIVTAANAAKIIGIGHSSFTQACKNVPPEYTMKEAAKKLYGNPKTLAAYRKLRGIED